VTARAGPRSCWLRMHEALTAIEKSAWSRSAAERSRGNQNRANAAGSSLGHSRGNVGPMRFLLCFSMFVALGGCAHNRQYFRPTKRVRGQTLQGYHEAFYELVGPQ